MNNRYLFFIIASILATGITNCTSRPSSADQPNDVKLDQYYVSGEQLYIAKCSNCHQKEGTGLGLVYPPIAKSDYVDNYLEDVLCLIRNGKSGELIVNGKSFNQAMPANPALSDLEIAEIATYIYNTWGRKRGLVEVSKVSKVLNECPATSATPTE